MKSKKREKFINNVKALRRIQEKILFL